jgi:hypothetical protein
MSFEKDYCGTDMVALRAFAWASRVVAKAIVIRRASTSHPFCWLWWLPVPVDMENAK